MQKSKSKLMILTGKNCVLPNLVQEFIEIETWLLLTFFICSHNELSSIRYPSSHIKQCRCLKKVVYRIDSKYERFLLSASFTAKFEVIFVLTQDNALISEV